MGRVRSQLALALLASVALSSDLYAQIGAPCVNDAPNPYKQVTGWEKMSRSWAPTNNVYVDGKDKVWVSDFGANAVLKFDPETKSFASFPSDKPDAAVRQLNGRPGEVWGAESGTDRLVVIRTGDKQAKD